MSAGNSWLGRLMSWFSRIFAKREVVRATNGLTRQRQETRATASENGAYLKLDDFLLDLDEKFGLLEKTKFPKYRGFVEEAKILQWYGAYIMGQDSMMNTEECPIEFAVNQPPLVLTSVPGTEEDNVLGDWLFLWRVDGYLPDVERTRPGETCYVMEVLCPGQSNLPQFNYRAGHYAVTRAGEFRELRYKVVDENNRSCWRYAPFDYAEPWFLLMASVYAKRDRHWSVCATNSRGWRVSATIPDNDAPRFFRKVGSHGNRFHVVVAHQRANGQNVRTHWRGNRHFRHGEYDLTVNVPGLKREERRLVA